jgi:hypothetical protein
MQPHLNGHPGKAGPWAYAVALLKFRWQHRRCWVVYGRGGGWHGFYCITHQQGLGIPLGGQADHDD